MSAAAPERQAAEALLASHLGARHPSETARLLEVADDHEAIEFLAAAPTRVAVEIHRRLTPDRAAALLAIQADRVAGRVLAGLDPARAAALLARLDADRRDVLLDKAEPTRAREWRDLMAYPENTAGALMDPRVVTFAPDAVARDVTRRLRRLRRLRIADVYLVGLDGLLVGSVPLTEIVLAEPGARLDGLSRGLPPTVQAVASREEVMDVLQSHGRSSLPVVDFEGRLLGVLDQQELLAAAEADATAGLVTMVGAGREERALSPPWYAVRKRLPWLQINLLTAFLAAAVVGLFEGTIARFTALAVLLPVVAGQSGNTGAQALAVTMRGLALREVRVRHWLVVGGKELLVGTANGVAVALTTSLAVFVWSRSAGLAAVIGVSMVISMALAGLSGAVIPMALTALRQDPAQSSSIILTTVTDVTGFFSFLGIATALSRFL